jgi:hypothetical protein
MKSLPLMHLHPGGSRCNIAQGLTNESIQGNVVFIESFMSIFL